MKSILPFLLLVASFIGITFVLIAYKVSKVPAEPVHYHANFAVFEDGTQIDFTKPEMMHIKPCTDQEIYSTDPKDNVHLHDQIGNVVHLHQNGISWKTFFSTVKLDLDKNTEGKKLLVYQNENLRDSKILDEEIKKQDRVLIHIATVSAASLDPETLKKEYEAVGNTASEYDAGKGGAEKCGTEGKRSLWRRFQIAFTP